MKLTSLQITNHSVAEEQDDFMWKQPFRKKSWFSPLPGTEKQVSVEVGGLGNDSKWESEEEQAANQHLHLRAGWHLGGIAGCRILEAVAWE